MRIKTYISSTAHKNRVDDLTLYRLIRSWITSFVNCRSVVRKQRWILRSEWSTIAAFSTHAASPLVKVQHGNTKVKKSPTLLKKGPYANEFCIAFTRVRDKDERPFTQIELVNRVLITQNYGVTRCENGHLKNKI